MNFCKHILKRLDEWEDEDGREKKRFIEEAQEKLIDCYIYINIFAEKNKSVNIILVDALSGCKKIYNDLEKLK